MKVVLAVPPFSAAPRPEAARIKRGKLRPLPPLGLGYLAAALERHGHTVVLIDSQARELSLDRAVDALLAEGPDVVGISSFTVFTDVSYALAAGIKARRPDLTVVLGGPHATAFHEAILSECPSVDFVVPGEADETLANLVDRLSSRVSKSGDTSSSKNDVLAQMPTSPPLNGGRGDVVFCSTVESNNSATSPLPPFKGGLSEQTSPDLRTDVLGQGAPFDDLPGIIFRNAALEIVATPPAPILRNLDELPNPARHIYENRLYVPLPNQSRRRPATTVMTARGCPWAQCRFCYQGGKYGSPYRRRSPEHVVAELRHLADDLGFREVLFWDDNFCVNEKWITAFCDLLDQERLDLTWTAQGRVNTVTRTMLQRMAVSGCYNIFFGFESGNQDLLNLIDKGITLDESRQAVRWANEAGLEVRGAFMFGLPTETPAMAEETIRFACELGVDYMIFSPYHIQRGTPLEAIALQQGRVVEAHREDFNWSVPSYVPNAYPNAEALAEVVRSAYRRFYLRPRYILRALRRAKDPVILRNYLRAFLHWWNLTRRNG